jgi:RimJ/RimL family protein N-acetyltransferase
MLPPRNNTRGHVRHNLSVTRFRTPRLDLRPVTAGDAELLQELDSDPEVMRHLNGGLPTPLATIKERILPRFLAFPQEAEWAGVWLAYERSSGAFLGWCSLRPGPDGTAELGYRLRRASWGRGLATEGASALLRHAFQTHAVPVVFATTYEENLASLRVLEKLGMKLVRRFRPEPGEATFEPDGGEPWPGDDLEYAVTAEAWAARRCQP